ncbi:hypothetical protein CR203_23005 [Salipaludibacillus neizhouensis]|uniref:Polymerase/histidinol phosphatase N-terminal domain-containing protein n=1 Tax=Salipaludibacillus neizhouensis TaxID=885475 RepID=A0A3A9JVP5_9BACI|nr:CehA/McbA family metallohydrolase [Salipaludibacillus neizhouensis]RKL65004.1 hypothetical protein CR203_23005 [Salipaludibacillus neizhouensis]
MRQHKENLETISLMINEKIPKEIEGQYITLPFEVFEPVQEIKVHLEVLGEGENVIDLGLEGPDGLKGWSGGARRSLFVREDRATPGYTLEKLKKGTWGVVLNAYKIGGACRVEVTVEMKPESPQWIKGDLHMHSNHSDSPYSLSEVITNAKNAGLEYIALTDHNTFSQNEAFEPQEDLVIIPAVELTTNRGHSNFYGVKRPFNDFRCQTIQDVKRIISEGKANNALISANHPHCDNCWWDWGLENFDFEYVEIWNGPWSDRNLRALNWWHEQLVKGKRIIALGGSDKHGPDEWIKYGEPTTAVEASIHSPQGILKAIEKGRVSILSTPKGAVIDLHINGRNMGDTVRIPEDSTNVNLNVSIQNPIYGTLRVYSSEGLCVEQTLELEDNSLSFSLKSDVQFYRVEVWGEDKRSLLLSPQAISNPIFINGSRD